MTRLPLAPLAAGLLLAVAAPAHAQPASPAGTWKLGFVVGTDRLLVLIKLDQAGDKWSGQVLGASEGLPQPPTVSNVSVTGDRLRFTLNVAGQPLSFDGKVPAQPGGKALGSLALTEVLGGDLLLVQLVPSNLKDLKDNLAIAREALAQAQPGPEVVDAVLAVLTVGEGKLPVEEARQLATRAEQSAAAYGPRWRRTVALRLAQTLLGQKGLEAVALEQAKLAEGLLEPSDGLSTQIQLLGMVMQALARVGRADEVRQVKARIAELERKDFEEHEQKVFTFKPSPYPGRRAKSDRAVLFELFTGSECPPCVAADIGFEAVERSYKPTEVILLQYHLHIPGPDPLTSPDGEERSKYYGDDVGGTPATFFSGKAIAGGGGPARAAEAKYKEYSTAIDPLLEKPAGVKIQLTANRDGGKLVISAKATDLAKPGRVSLRLALAEERVRYPGGNGVRYHHCVVRALPGGVKGVPVTSQGGEQNVTVDLDQLRGQLNSYLDKYSAENGHRFGDRPLALKGLRVVAFVQDDTTKEVLHAVQATVPDQGE
jgi:hypothetical protein